MFVRSLKFQGHKAIRVQGIVKYNTKDRVRDLNLNLDEGFVFFFAFLFCFVFGANINTVQ
jgi:hypothetical protein